MGGGDLPYVFKKTAAMCLATPKTVFGGGVVFGCFVVLPAPCCSLLRKPYGSPFSPFHPPPPES